MVNVLLLTNVSARDILTPIAALQFATVKQMIMQLSVQEEERVMVQTNVLAKQDTVVTNVKMQFATAKRITNTVYVRSTETVLPQTLVYVAQVMLDMTAIYHHASE